MVSISLTLILLKKETNFSSSFNTLTHTTHSQSYRWIQTHRHIHRHTHTHTYTEYLNTSGTGIYLQNGKWAYWFIWHQCQWVYVIMNFPLYVSIVWCHHCFHLWTVLLGLITGISYLVSSGSRIWSRGGPSSGPPNLANVVEQSWASEASISRHGVWGPP